MGAYNLGSIANNVLARFPDCSVGVSGQLLQIVDEQRFYMEERTGLSIGSVGIAEKFQPALTSLSIANAMELTKLDGANAASLTLGEFEITHSSNDNLNTAAINMRAIAEEQLKRLGFNARFSRVIG